MTAITVLRQGESLPFVFSRGGLPIDGWECTVVVKQYPGDTALIAGTVEPSDRVWKGFLTSAQTDTLPTGITYRLAAILTNAQTDEEEQVVDDSRFSVSEKWGVAI